MLWLLVILLIAGLSFVLFHKPHVNSMGAGWTPPERRHPAPAQPAAAPVEDAVTLRLRRHEGSAEDAITLRLVRQPAPEMPDTLELNDLLGGSKPRGPSDQPNA